LAGNLINYLLAGNRRPTTCTKVGNAGLEALAKGLPAQMTSLTLNVRETKEGNAGPEALAKGLPAQMQSLTLKQVQA